jgi:Mn2+/Fe2+ NRAMP family transporter
VALGLALIVVAVAVWQAHPDWGGMLHGAIHPVVPGNESHATYWCFAIALLGSAMTPYEVFFFSSGAVEQRWTRSDLPVNRLNVYIGFPLGGLLALALMVAAALVREPRGIDPDHLSQAALPTSLVLGKLGLALALLGFFACTPGGPPRRRRCRAATPSPSTSAGSGASSSSRSRPPASSWSCWSRSRSAPVWC